MLDTEYASLVEAVKSALDSADEADDQLVVAGDAYIAWDAAHPGAYQLLFESDDALPETRAAHGPRLQARIVELARPVDPAAPFASALLLWSAWHGVALVANGIKAVDTPSRTAPWRAAMCWS